MATAHNVIDVLQMLGTVGVIVALIYAVAGARRETEPSPNDGEFWINGKEDSGRRLRSTHRALKRIVERAKLAETPDISLELKVSRAIEDELAAGMTTTRWLTHVLEQRRDTLNPAIYDAIVLGIKQEQAREEARQK